MNALLLRLGIEWIKPIVTALVLPPVPFLLLACIGWRLERRRRRIGAAMLLSALVLTWLCGCVAVAHALGPVLLRLPPALDSHRIEDMRRQANDTVAIIVLGGGVEPWAPEYQTSSLSFRSLERLRYGVWLHRRTGWPVGFSGGVGWGQPANGAKGEATVAQRIAREEYGEPLRWVETTSRDTRENAVFTAALLHRDGIRRVVLVTHDWHMPRAVRNFQRSLGPDVHIDAAPIGLANDLEMPVLRWIPTGEGMVQVRTVLREWVGGGAGS